MHSAPPWSNVQGHCGCILPGEMHAACQNCKCDMMTPVYNFSHNECELPLPQQCFQVMRVWMLPPVAAVKRPLHKTEQIRSSAAKGAEGFRKT